MGMTSDSPASARSAADGPFCVCRSLVGGSRHAVWSVAVFLEVTPKQTFASALDWPGWCRADRDEDAALAALATCSGRYAPVVEEAGVSFPSAVAFDIVDRVPGPSATAFAAPECRRPFPQVTAEAETATGTPAAARRLADLVGASRPG